MQINPFNRLNIYKKLLDDLDGEFIFSINNTEYLNIKRIIKNDIKRNPEDWRLNLEKYSDNRIPLFYAILNVSRSMISSGKHHNFRGRLDSHGQELVQVFNKCLNELLDVNETNAKDVKDATEDLADAIERVG